MKLEEVPQDGEILGRENNSVRDVCYAVDHEGNYRQVLSVGWKPKNEANLLHWDIIEEEAEEARQAALSGKESPLRFHMVRCLLDLDLMAQYTGWSKKTIKKHYAPATFNKLDPESLALYAKVMNITVDELRTV